MKRFSMGITVFILTMIGILLNINHVSPVYFALFLVMFLWSAVEFYIGGCKSFEGTSTSHPVIKINRILWPVYVLYSWIDTRNGWSLIIVPHWLRVGLLILCFLGLFIRLWAVLYLGSSFSYDIKRPAGKNLIQTGPYGLIRHPSYLGITILSSFPGLIAGSLLGFLGMTATSVLHIVFRINAEEKVLQNVFGDIFKEYEKRTYKLIPFIY